jgi:hypothetical protein
MELPLLFSIAGIITYIAFIKNENSKRHINYEILGFFIFPFCGFLLLFIFSSDFEMLDIEYIWPFWIVQFLYTLLYFHSKTNKSENGVLLNVFSINVFIVGLIYLGVMAYHLSVVFFLSLLSSIILIGFLGFPLLGIPMSMWFLTKEIKSLFYHIESHFENIEDDIRKSNLMYQFYSGNHLQLKLFITIPLLLLIIPLGLILFSIEPQILLKVFSESDTGLLANGSCEGCQSAFNSNSSDDYLCTIASHGSPVLVKPIHIGFRKGYDIPVNMQLKVCNAFEEKIMEQFPMLHQVLRKIYDGMQIPAHKWKNAKLIANTLYILIKPIEKVFLLYLFTFDSKPFRRIKVQYL